MIRSSMMIIRSSMMIKRICILFFCSLLCLALFPSYAEPPLDVERTPSTERFGLVIADIQIAGTYFWRTTRGEFMPAHTVVNYSMHDCGFAGGPITIRVDNIPDQASAIGPPRSGKLSFNCKVAQGGIL